MSIRNPLGVIFPAVFLIVFSSVYAVGFEESNDPAITVKVILQTHRSPLQEFPSNADTLAKVHKSEDFILETLKKTSGDVNSAVVEAVFTVGSNLQPVSYSETALELFGGNSILKKIGDYVKVYGFENKETHASGLLLLKRMFETTQIMKDKSEKLKDIGIRLRTVAGEMKTLAVEMKNENDNDKIRLLNQRFRNVEDNVKIIQSEFQFIMNEFKKIQAENQEATVAFNTFRVIRSTEALQTALQVAINNHEKSVYLIIGSMHWDDLVAIENRIDTVKPRIFKLEKLEPN